MDSVPSTEGGVYEHANHGKRYLVCFMSHRSTKYTSAPSSLNSGVEPLQFHAGILDAELLATPILSLEVALVERFVSPFQVKLLVACKVEAHRAAVQMVWDAG